MTTTKKAVDPNDPAPIACQKLIMEFSVHAGRRDACAVAGAHTGRNAADTDPYLPLLLLTYAKHIHIRTRRAQASHAQTDSLQVQRALSAYILVSSCHNVRRSHIWQRENHVTGEMLSLRANCRFQVRAVVDLSLPALGE